MRQSINTRKGLILGLLLCVLTVAPLSTAQVPTTEQLWDMFTAEMKASRMDASLFIAKNEYQSFVARGEPVVAYQPSDPSLPYNDGFITIDVSASGDANALLADLQALGLTNGTAYGRVVSGRLPIGQLARLDTLPTLHFAYASRFATNVGLTTSQAVEALDVDLARPEFGVDGRNVAIGTISDSYNCLGGAASDVASNDLPLAIQVLQEGDCIDGTDEGRGMMQLIHDIAPGSDQLFHTADFGQANFAQGILDLANAGADVIVDDIIYLAEPMFQDGIVADAADQVVAQGVPYFSSAGNNARQSYEAPFRNNGGNFHDFDPGGGSSVNQRITVNSSSTLILQWTDPFFSVSGTGAATDLDILIFNTSGTLLATFGTNNLGGDPIEGVNFPAGTYDIRIGKATGPDPIAVKYVWFGDITVNTFATNSPSSYGHAVSDGAIAVGASFYFFTPRFGTNPPLLENFSSAGGTPIYYLNDGTFIPGGVVRNKPEITSIDGTNTTFFGSGDSEGDGFPNFFGTSAAAPHAAAVAGLMLDADPTLTPATILSTLQGTTIDIPPAGFDFDSGSGLIQADTALASLFNARGDCNGDGNLNSSDLGTLRDELFDGDGLDYTNVQGGSVVGDEIGCDANNDEVINAADLACTAQILNGNLACTTFPN